MIVFGCLLRGIFNRKDIFIFLLVGFLIFSVKIILGINDSFVFFVWRVLYVNKFILILKNFLFLILSFDIGKDFEYDKFFILGYLGGGCVFKRVVFVFKEEFIFILSIVLFNVFGLSLVDLFGDWFLRVYL